MEEKEKSSTGLEENVAGFLCYILGFITGIVFLIVEKRSSFVRFHARQSTITFLALVVIKFIVMMIPFFNLLFFPIWAIFSLVLWLLLMIKALQGKRYVLPIVGKWAEEKNS